MDEPIDAVDVTGEANKPEPPKFADGYTAVAYFDSGIEDCYWSCCCDGLHESSGDAVRCLDRVASPHWQKDSIRVYRLGGESKPVAIDWGGVSNFVHHYYDLLLVERPSRNEIIVAVREAVESQLKGSD